MKTVLETPDKKPDGGADDARGPSVEFLDLLTNNEVRFHVDWNDTLLSAWKTAYKKLGETQTPDDKLLCGGPGGDSLMDYLKLTFTQLRERKICPGHKYKIRRPTGGA